MLLAALLLFVHFAQLIFSYLSSWIRSNIVQHPGNECPPRLSKPHNQLKPCYDVVVIGSGYGGGVAASRMARATPRQSVCLLERGRERWPGEYPSGHWSAILELRFMGHIRMPFRSFPFDIGKRTGLYQWIVGKGSNVFVGTGAGK